MLERDWAKDWELCQRYNAEYSDLVEKLKVEKDFFLTAIEALPYWLQRVRELEEENRRLWAVVEAAIRYLNTCNPYECIPLGTTFRMDLCGDDAHCPYAQLKKAVEALTLLEEAKD